MAQVLFDFRVKDQGEWLLTCHCDHNDGHVALACQSRDGWRGVEPASELQGHHAHLQRIRHGVPEIPPVIRCRFIFSGGSEAGGSEAGQVRYWQYGQAENSPDLAISDLSRFLSQLLT